MTVGIFLGHPAHFHMLKNAAKQLQQRGHAIHFVVKQKDILEKLLQEAGYDYTLIRETRSGSLWGLVKSVVGMERNMCFFLRKYNIDLLIGSTLSFASRCIMHIPTIAMGEDDAIVVPKYAKMVYPWANQVLSPISCNNGRWEQKTVHYHGFQKLAYLHPNQFVADAGILKKYGISPDKPYFLLRFAKLNAHHDEGIQGISTEVAQRIIGLFKQYNTEAQIFITSERTLEPEFEQYRLQINPLDIHHIMAFATLYVGDSQSMAVEAAMLGVPSLRFNDFVGQKKIGVMEELEHIYGLTYGISSHKPEALYAKIEEFMAMPDLRAEFQKRRQRMLADKIDVTKFLTWFIENYPASAQKAKSATFDWNAFK